MLSAVNFDDQSFFQTYKIDDVTSHWLLSAKFATVNLPVNEASAKATARHRLGFAVTVGLSNALRSFPLSLPFPARGKGIDLNTK